MLYGRIEAVARTEKRNDIFKKINNNDNKKLSLVLGFRRKPMKWQTTITVAGYTSA